MKDVNIRVFGSCCTSNSERNGYYVVELQYKNVVQYIEGTEIHTTSNRMIIKGLIEGIRKLKEQCNIKAYATTPIGLSYIKGDRVKNCVNKVYLEELNNVLMFGGHKLELIVSMDHVERLKKLNRSCR